MADIIKLLPDHVANQIAAGEVVQRPASVVKELLENAIDAGATSIKLIVKEGGKNLIQVIDDGIGMTATDARMGFERHATSKIQKAEDLFNLNTKQIGEHDADKKSDERDDRNGIEQYQLKLHKEFSHSQQADGTEHTEDTERGFSDKAKQLLHFVAN